MWCTSASAFAHLSRPPSLDLLAPLLCPTDVCCTRSDIMSKKSFEELLSQLALERKYSLEDLTTFVNLARTQGTPLSFPVLSLLI